MQGTYRKPRHSRKGVSPFHEPPLFRPSATLSPHRGERAGRGARPGRFLAGEQVQKEQETAPGEGILPKGESCRARRLPYYSSRQENTLARAHSLALAGPRAPFHNNKQITIESK
jgi:hypothetical protein